MTGRLVSARGLLVPADLRRRVEAREVPLTSAAMSDLIGGGLLEEAYGSLDDQGFVMYLDERRVELGLPLNDRAAIMSARLGVVGRTWMQTLRGDLLILGADENREDRDVPRRVIDLARLAGLLESLEPRFLPAVDLTSRSRARR